MLICLKSVQCSKFIKINIKLELLRFVAYQFQKLARSILSQLYQNITFSIQQERKPKDKANKREGQNSPLKGSLQTKLSNIHIFKYSYSCCWPKRSKSTKTRIFIRAKFFISYRRNNNLKSFIDPIIENWHWF